MTNVYYELTKQRTSQSMRMSGARKAYNLLESFLQEQTVDPVFSKTSISYCVWTDSWRATRFALGLEDQLIKDFGNLKDYDMGQAATARVDPFENYRQIATIEPVLSAIEVMDYLDRLGPLRELKPRPPISAVVSATFYIPGANTYQESAEFMKSRMIAWLSPSSNSVSYSLHFPHDKLSSEFEQSKMRFEQGCGVELEDKYFYVRTKKPNGKWTYRRLYHSSAGD